MEFDKEFLNEERTRYRAHAVALHLSKERLYPRKRFRFPADPNLSRLGPAIALPEGFPCIFTDKEISEDMCDRLRAIAGAIASTDNKHSPLRCQPFQEEPGPGTCISTTLEENVQISSSDEVAVAVVSLSVQRPQVRVPGSNQSKGKRLTHG